MAHIDTAFANYNTLFETSQVRLHMAKIQFQMELAAAFLYCEGRLNEDAVLTEVQVFDVSDPCIRRGDRLRYSSSELDKPWPYRELIANDGGLITQVSNKFRDRTEYKAERRDGKIFLVR